MCVQSWQTVNKHQSNEHLPSLFSVAGGTQLFFLPCHPSMDRIPSLPPALLVSHTLPTVPFSPQHFLSLELLLFLCSTVVLFALAPGWEPAQAFWAAGTCWLPSSSVSELLQEPHRTPVLNIPTFFSRKSSRSSSIQSPISIQYCQFGQY